MIIYIVISILLILGSIVFFDLEFSLLRGSRSKVGGQIAWASWFALTTALAMVIPIILVSLSHKNVIGQFLMSYGLYLIWFLAAGVFYEYTLQVVYHGSVTSDYRCRVAADDADLVPEED
jgi:hypothetical protein